MVVSLGIALGAATSLSQAPAATPPTPPLDPDALMRQAADAMSLTAPEMKPWHLHASFVGFTSTGQPEPATTMEIWSASPGRYKVTYTTGKFSRSEYWEGEKGSYTGWDQPMDFGAWLLLHPLPFPARLQELSFTAKEASVGTNKLQCLTEAAKAAVDKSDLVSSYCFNTNLPLLRINLDSYGQRTTFNNLVRLHGHYVAKDIKVSNTWQDPQYTINVDQVDPGLAVDASSLVPPPEAKPIEKRANLSNRALIGNKISGENPQYPAALKSVRATGKVVLEGTLTREGKVVDIHALEGPDFLRAGAIKGVQTWVFHPYLIAGEPVALKTRFDISFGFNERESGP